MLDDETIVRIPHAATVTRKAGRTERKIDDPRTSVEMQERGAALIVFFDREHGQLLEVRLSAPKKGRFEPWRLMPGLPAYVQYARASIAGTEGDIVGAIRALRQVASTRRGLSDDFLKLVAQLYTGLVEEGEPYPVKALAELQPVDLSTASRWITAARQRGFLEEKKP